MFDGLDCYSVVLLPSIQEMMFHPRLEFLSFLQCWFQVGFVVLLYSKYLDTVY